MKLGEVLFLFLDWVTLETYMEDDEQNEYLDSFDLEDGHEYDRCELLYGGRILDHVYIRDERLHLVLV